MSGVGGVSSMIMSGGWVVGGSNITMPGGCVVRWGPVMAAQ